MASELKVNTLTGVSTAGSIAVTGEGNSTTTNLQQGLAKVFSSLAHESGTPTAKDTFNVSSYVDAGTGVVTVMYTNNMGVSNHCVGALANYRDSSAQIKHVSLNANTSFSSDRHPLLAGEGTWTLKDSENISSTAHGDLA